MVNRPKNIGTERPIRGRIRTAPTGVGSTSQGLTHSSGTSREGLAMQATRTLADRLWSKIRKTETGCWEFTGFCHPTRGYGQIGRGTRAEGNVETHRAAWELTHGPIPDGMVVRHKCDNPPCINPDHLELGTHQDNVNDAVARGRVARGNRLPQTRLTPGAAADIRRAYAEGQRQKDIAAAYGISQGHVSEIVNGNYWTETV